MLFGLPNFCCLNCGFVCIVQRGPGPRYSCRSALLWPTVNGALLWGTGESSICLTAMIRRYEVCGDDIEWSAWENDRRAALCVGHLIRGSHYLSLSEPSSSLTFFIYFCCCSCLCLYSTSSNLEQKLLYTETTSIMVGRLAGKNAIVTGAAGYVFSCIFLSTMRR